MISVNTERAQATFYISEEGEELKVFSWRAEELVRAGYDDDAATRLALCKRVDLHEAIELLKTGCSQELALQILL